MQRAASGQTRAHFNGTPISTSMSVMIELSIVEWEHFCSDSTVIVHIKIELDINVYACVCVRAVCYTDSQSNCIQSMKCMWSAFTHHSLPFVTCTYTIHVCILCVTHCLSAIIRIDARMPFNMRTQKQLQRPISSTCSQLHMKLRAGNGEAVASGAVRTKIFFPIRL